MARSLTSMDQRSYTERVLPWGETCREAEKRLSHAKLRVAWDQLRSKLYGDAKRSGDKITWNEASYRAFLEYGPDVVVPGTAPLVTTTAVMDDGEAALVDAQFIECCREGLKMSLPRRASIDDEVSWVAENLNRNRPDVHRAPSYAALNLAIEVRVSDRVRADFWRTYLSKRMSPGDTSARSKKKAFKEDQVSEVDAAGREHESDLMDRLFGGGEDGGL